MYVVILFVCTKESHTWMWWKSNDNEIKGQDMVREEWKYNEYASEMTKKFICGHGSNDEGIKFWINK